MSVSSDTGSHTWHDCGPGLVAGSTGSIECWYALNTGTTASETITVTAGGSIYPMTTWEVTGAATSNPIDGGSGGGYSDITIAYSGSIGANNMSAASITPVTNGDLILTMFSPASGTITPGTLPNAFTNIGSTGYGVSYFFQSVTASIQATAGLSASGVAYSNITVAVKP
jgi:hypothetical protein